MTKAWIWMADRFDALQPRERVTVFIGLLAVLVGLFYVLALDRGLLRYAQARKSLQQSEKLMVALREQELALAQTTALMPDVAANERIARLRADNEAARGRLSSGNLSLVSAEKMRTVLSDLIAAQKGLTLVSIRSLATVDLLADSANMGGSAPLASRASSSPSIYRQGLEITVRGDYRSLADYVRQVETLPWKVRLDALSLKTETYPLSSLKIVLHTLSLERPWIAL